LNTLLFLLALSPSLAAGDNVFRIPENSAVGAVVGTVAISRADATEDLRYAITAGNTGDAFAVDAKTGRITVRNGSALDFEANPYFNLTVHVKNVAAKTGDNLRQRFFTQLLRSGVDPRTVQDLLVRDTLHMTVNLDDVNEPPRLDDQSFRMTENGAVGTVLGSLTASDPDRDDTLSYAITAGNTGAAFAIDSETGQITVRNGSSLDFETNPRFQLKVQVTDSTGASDTAIATVSLCDVDEAPSVDTPPPGVPGKKTNSAAPIGPAPSDAGAGDAPSAVIVDGSRRSRFLVALAVVCLLWYASSRFARSKSRKPPKPKELHEECVRLHNRIAELDGKTAQLQARNDELAGELERQRKEIATERAALDAQQRRLEEERESLRIERERLEVQQMQFTEQTSAENSSADVFEVDEEPESSEAESEWPQEETAEALCSALAGVAAPDEEMSEYHLDDAQNPDSVADYMRGLLDRSRNRGSQSFNPPQLSSRQETSADKPWRSDRREDPSATATAEVILEEDDPLADSWTDDVNTPVEHQGETERAERAPAVSSPRKPVDKEAVRSDMDSLREIANLTARTAITRHARKKQKKRLLVAGTIAAVSYATAAVLLTGELWGAASYPAQGWAATGVGSLMMIEIVRSLLSGKQQ